MKKTLLVLLCSICLLGVTGCGSQDNKDPRDKKATVVDNTNTTIEISANELYNISKENEAKWKKYYIGSKITFEGTVSSVESDTQSCYKATTYERLQSELKSISGVSIEDKTKCATIYFEEGFKLLIPSNTIIDIADIEVGNKYNVKTNIIYMWNDQVEVFGIEESGAVNFEETKIELIEGK